MPQEDPEFWERAHRGQKMLIEQFLEHEDVVLIDIGYSEETNDLTGAPAVLRIHVRKQWFEEQPEERVVFPTSVEGIPVIVIPGDYRFT